MDSSRIYKHQGQEQLPRNDPPSAIHQQVEDRKDEGVRRHHVGQEELAKDQGEDEIVASTPPTPTKPPRRQKSLVRPERERIDEHHRQYHYRQQAMTTTTRVVEPSTTGSRPAPSEQRPRYASGRWSKPAEDRSNPLRRGHSILGRSDRRPGDEDDVGAAGGAVMTSSQSPSKLASSNQSPSKRFFCNCSNLWILYCRLLTCCIPNFLLRLVGIPNGPAQMAWREKIGLVSFILGVMGCVGFLTFGFTQVICPTPPMTVQGHEVGSGYLIIRGWAYMLANWNSHPPIPGQTSDPTNVLYAPIDAAGMDASFLFQEIQPPACADVFPPKQIRSVFGSFNSRNQSATATAQPPQVYFPCQMFNPNDTTSKALYTTSTNKNAACHLTSNARNLLHEFQTKGIPRVDGTGLDKIARIYYDWSSVNSTDYLMVYNGDVLNLKLLNLLSTSQYNITSDSLVGQILANPAQFGGRDMTRFITNSRRRGVRWEQEAKCLATLIKVGSVDTLSIGCMASNVVLYLSLVVILGVILARFSLAVIFGWFLSWRLGNFKEQGSYKARMRREAELELWTRDIHTAAAPTTTVRPPVASHGQKRRSLLPQTSRFTQPMPNSTRFNSERLPTPVWKTPSSTLEDYTSRRSSYFLPTSSPSPSSRHLPLPLPSVRRSSMSSSSEMQSTLASSPVCPQPLSPHVLPQPPSDYMPFNYPLAYTFCLVTCYSEGLEGVRTTLDSIATSDYPNSHKLILVVCDGLITGHGESMSTPDVCISMMCDFIEEPDQVEALSYVAIADGAKRNNMGKVYAGFYKYDDTTVAPEHQLRVPMITIVKCGTPEEANEKKPGNRGKRDSQIILMQFMQKVMFDERMTAMEYAFFNAIWRTTGIPADRYEIVLMVDADTKLFPDALSRLVSCAVKDPEISGLCGETRIANKTGSWVSMIQVFEYYISHHQSKAFESIFGGVTCLPGCFCMYRIKAPKGPNGYWVPILANPDIVEHYSENIVDTLHKKNLLLLGEDRYLSTLMLKTFPNRKMMFVPQAACKTVVPDTFGVLLSQRRRWINSTIHNLMELVLVHDLCGTFCFSMQFVVFMELVGTLALPAAISFTLYLIVLAIIGQPAIIPLLLLALILGLPAILIVMTSRKIVYVGWMIIYLFSLPIWNFVLPTYAYWHFDDFSWGDTRKVEGANNDAEKQGHGDKEGEFDAARVPMKKWSDFEKERRTAAIAMGLHQQQQNSDMSTGSSSTLSSSSQHDLVLPASPPPPPLPVAAPAGGGVRQQPQFQKRRSSPMALLPTAGPNMAQQQQQQQQQQQHSSPATPRPAVSRPNLRRYSAHRTPPPPPPPSSSPPPATAPAPQHPSDNDDLEDM
ncbi:chitin synthase-domain-containing protein [Dichotomocladium elegans]|nr:chitin synthase-domain-containing protein [Dichotomocladium elegans]